MWGKNWGNGWQRIIGEMLLLHGRIFDVGRNGIYARLLSKSNIILIILILTLIIKERAIVFVKIQPVHHKVSYNYSRTDRYLLCA